MNVPADRAHDKPNVAANSLSGLESSTTATFDYVDNRPEAITQRKIKEAIDNSPQAKQLRAYQEMASSNISVIRSSNAPVQLSVHWDGLVEKTSPGNYGVSPDRGILYGKAAAQDPQPTGMYATGVEATDDEPAVELSTWKPNVKFLSGDVIDQGHVLSEVEKANWHDPKYVRPTVDKVLAELRPEYERIKREVAEAIGANPRSPNTGIVGRNDCAQWASALQVLINTVLKNPSTAVREFDMEDEDAPNMEGAQPVHLGDKMEQSLSKTSRSRHHGATVVATDGESLVTLEAHVEKEIGAPKFHIYEGLLGFVTSNNSGEREDKSVDPNMYLKQNGRKGTVRPPAAVDNYADARLKALRQYSDQLKSNDNEVKLEAIQSLLRYYETIIPQINAEASGGGAEFESKSSVEPPPVKIEIGESSGAEDVSKPKKKWCFLTTACVNYRGLPDDCEELTVLRGFRDNYMRKLPDGDLLIEKYYKVAPEIVAMIDRAADPRKIYDDLYVILRTCVEAIKAGDNSLALQVYKDMVIRLHQEFISNRE